MKIVLVDHDDSFTWNVAHLFGELAGERPIVVQSRDLDPRALLAAAPDLLLLGPGPGHPENAADAGRSLELIRANAGRVPLFGVCFGLQLLVVACGGRVVRAAQPMHGKSSPIVHRGGGLFAGLPMAVKMMRYHSLVVARTTLPAELDVTAESQSGEVMAIAHAQWPACAVQFHPESVGSPMGRQLAANVLEWANGVRSARRGGGS